MTFSSTIRAISWRISFGSAGRPPRDFQRPWNWKPLRCQRMNESVVTMVSDSFQSKKRDQNTSDKRAHLSVVVGERHAPRTSERQMIEGIRNGLSRCSILCWPHCPRSCLRAQPLRCAGTLLVELSDASTAPTNPVPFAPPLTLLQYDRILGRDR